MKGEVLILNRQRQWRVDTPLLKQLTAHLLREDFALPDWQIGIILVGPRAMADLNAHWLGHAGSTDILTFDHAVPGSRGLDGELVISPGDAVAQARRFHTTPALELIRYVVHGILHLRGHDDTLPAARRVMKREEDRWVRRLAARWPLRTLILPAKIRPTRPTQRQGHG